MKRRPRDVKSDRDCITLNTDNFGTEEGWILVDGAAGTVTVACQAPGFPSESMTTLSRSTFRRLVDWYNRPQTIKKEQP